MAWLDDSPVVHADEKEFEISAANTGYPLELYTGKLSSIYQFPIFRILFQWYQAFALSRNFHKKLTIIENKIHSTHFDEIATATALLRELLHLKRSLLRSFIGVLPPNKMLEHSPLTKFMKKVSVRNDQLKQYLIKKSHQVFKETEAGEKQVTISQSGNSHRQVLSVLGKTPSDKSHLLQKMPSRVYWRYAQDENNFANSYPTSSFKGKGLLYIHTSCHQLIQLLSKNGGQKLLSNKKDIKICNQGFHTENSQWACGVSLKLSPNSKGASEDIKLRPTFWQQEIAALGAGLISQLDPKILKESLTEIFFQTTKHYHDFKDLLHANQELELLELIASLEAQRQIIIPQDKRSHPLESALIPANKR